MERPDRETCKQIWRDYVIDWSDPESGHFHIRNKWSSRRTCTAFGATVYVGKVELRASDIWSYLHNRIWPWEVDPDYVEPPPARPPSIFVMWNETEIDDS